MDHFRHQSQVHALMQEIWPSRNVGKRPWRCLQPLSPWVSAMLSGASSLTDMSLGMEMLQWLPMSSIQVLESLCLDARNDLAARDAFQVVMDCQQLRKLTIVCHTKDAWCSYSERLLHLDITVDLRHLVHLKHCHLRCVPVPKRLFLLQGELELTMLPEQIAAWSKVWCQVQARVQSVTVEGYPYSSPIRLLDWPPGLDDLHGLQFLQLNCASDV